MGLWNELARHQSATKPFRLTRMEAKPDTDDIRRLCRTRTEELEGFIDGLFGDAELMDLPEWANEALDNLGKIYAMIRGIIDLLERESASEGVCLLFIHPGTPNLISLRSAGTMPA